MSSPPPTANRPPRRTALITGASAGIGRAFAEVFAANGFDVVLTARREERLHALAAELEARCGVRAHVITSDLAQRNGAARLCAELDTRGLTIDALVNNAGRGLPGTYTRSAWDEHAAFLQLMVTAVAELTHHLLPGMIERRYGRIVNVASLAGLVPAPAGHTLYAASKSFLIRFSEALANEGAPHGIHVTALCPGFTLSEFHDVTGTRALVSRLPAFMWMDAESVARQGFDAVMSGAPVFVNGRVNRLIALAARYLPYGLVSAFNRRAASRYRSH